MIRRALLLALLVPATAQAAYTPKPGLELSTVAPLAAPAITATLSQPGGQSNTQSIAAQFPPAFTYNPAFAVPGCSPADEQAATCPESSRIGTISVTSPYGDGAGPVHIMADLRLVAFISAVGGIYNTRAVGTIAVLDDGTAVIRFDDLPDLPVTAATIALEGGRKSVLVNPRRCGTYAVAVTFTSHQGEAVKANLPLTIAGCPPALVLRGAHLDGRTLHWRTSEPATTTVLLLRRSGATWREVRTRRTQAAQLVLGRLRAGRYRAVLRARTGDGRVSHARTVAF